MLDETTQKIADATRASRFDGCLFLVGGLLRDRALGLPSDQDIDIVCTLSALDVAEFLFAKGITDHRPVVYPRFGTAMVGVNGINIEFATSRRESYDPSSRKPDVEPASLEDDVLRRDFTINTLLQSIHSGEILDLTNRAYSDLEAKLVRTPLDPALTFQDDPLRMLRAVRFAAKLDFTIEQQTWDALLSCVDRLEIISFERIRDEFIKMLMLPGRVKALEMLRESGLLNRFIPELAALYGAEQNIYHLYDVWTHTMIALGNLPDSADLNVRLGMLFHDIGKPATKTTDADGGVHFYGHQSVGSAMTEEILKRLKFPNDVVDDVTQLVALHMRIGEYNQKWSDAAVRRLVRDFGDKAEELFTINEADKSACNPEYHNNDNKALRDRIRTIQKDADFAHLECPLSGTEIMDIAKISQGPLVGYYKDMLINEMLEGRLLPGDKITASEILKKTLEN